MTAANQLSFDEKILYIRTLEEEEAVIEKYLTEKERVVGFSCCWKSQSSVDIEKSSIVMIQLATPTKVFLFHIGIYNHPDNIIETNGDTNDDTDHEVDFDLTKPDQKEKEQPENNEEVMEVDRNNSQTNESIKATDSKAVLSKSLQYLLESNDILKVGVNICQDFMKLSEMFEIQFDSNSVLDLRDWFNESFFFSETKANEMDHNEAEPYLPYSSVDTFYSGLWTLETLAEYIFGQQICNPITVMTSVAMMDKLNWEMIPLNTHYQAYAANRAFVTLKIFYAIHCFNISCSDHWSGDANDLAYFEMLSTLRIFELESYKKNHDVMKKYWGWQWKNLIAPTHLSSTTTERGLTDFDALQALELTPSLFWSAFMWWKHHAEIGNDSWYVVHDTGDLPKLKEFEKEIATCFNVLKMDFLTIREFRGFKMSTIELCISELIDKGYEYNWKCIGDCIVDVMIFRQRQDRLLDNFSIDALSVSAVAFVDRYAYNVRKLHRFSKQWIQFQCHVVSALEVQLQHIFDSLQVKDQFQSSKKLSSLLEHYEANDNDLRLNPNKPSDPQKYRELLMGAFKTDFDRVWNAVSIAKIKSHVEDIANKEVDHSYLKYWLKYSILKIIVNHVKRVIWMHHLHPMYSSLQKKCTHKILLYEDD
ncbi:hypothetical protein RFI_19379 [Reticulomyxa filosa]|uniref:3'-5' exonuclease domain-containing protein n=1 Tax=Reticulomyxa filosa TaxID=46433 RepID=X6MWD3_RETFI|nr:hypothetical protein RFI_19379 [Reticulomyxa filosa]|eukprot:ETO17931.1 hypothetical protein RFI_19379 [Reticulomyxa filosa]